MYLLFIFFKTTIKTCFAQTQMLANELSFGGSLPQTFSTIPRKNFTDRPYNKPGQVPRDKCENVILQVPVYIYVTSIGYTY